jgi:hypothetical protein
MNFNFGEVLTRAWQIIWKHKVLWIFGILASCGRGGGGNGGGNTGGGGEGGFGNGPTDLPPQVERFLEWVVENATTFAVIAITLFCVFWIIAVFLGTIGRIGLIRGTAQAEGGEDNLIFGQLFSESTPYFWRLFGLSLIVSVPFLILVAFLVAGVLVFAFSMSQGSDAGAVGFLGMLPILIGCFCLLIPVGWVIGMIVRQAERAIVLEDSAVLPSLSRGWDIFRTNLGPIIVMAIILAVITLVAGFIIAIPVFIVVIPAAIAFAAGEAQNWTPMIFAGVCLCLYIPVSLILNGIMIAYSESAWTLTYMRLTRRPDHNDLVIPPSETPPPPDDSDKTMISA